MRGLFVIALLVLATPANAGPRCTDDSESMWLSKEEMLNRISKLGHTVEVFKKTKGNCYEIYGRDKRGKRIEIYFHPVTGDVVKASTL